MDKAARCVLDVALSEERHEVLNMTHPRPIRWDTMISHIGDALVDGGYTLPLSTIPLIDWVPILHASKNVYGVSGLHLDFASCAR